MLAIHLASCEKFRIHFTDNYGQASVECDSYESYKNILKNIENDPACEDIWTEYYDKEDGWQG